MRKTASARRIDVAVAKPAPLAPAARPNQEPFTALRFPIHQEGDASGRCRFGGSFVLVIQKLFKIAW
jgi:hypothetical protein